MKSEIPKISEINFLGENLRHLRKQKGLNVVEMGAILGVGKSMISYYENNLTMPDIDKLLWFSVEFGISIDSLIKEDLRNRTFPVSQNKNAHQKSIPNSTPITKPEKLGVQNGVKEPKVRYQRMLDMEQFHGDISIDHLKTLLEGRDKEIESLNRTIEHLKDEVLFLRGLVKKS